MKKRQFVRWGASLVCLVLMGFVNSSALAQKATITGTVTDAQSGEALPGANVVVRLAGTQGAPSGAASGADGSFTVKNLDPGTYFIEISFIGYGAKTFESVSLAAGETKTIDGALELTGIFANAISVSASRRPEKTLEAPASISVISSSEMRSQVGLSSVSILKNTASIDVAETGIDRKEVVLRGFNNAFSGATYILTDYRQTAVPSLGVNAHSIMPNMTVDLDKIEIVRGPGSALYGPGVTNGVIHYITKDPFTYPGTTVSLSGGERSLFSGAFRHAGTAGESFGYKVTAQYAQANDWELDPNDSDDLMNYNPYDPDDLDNTEKRPRNYDYQKYNVNASLQYRFTPSTSITANGGTARLTSTFLTGVGTALGDGFGYDYGQIRLQSGRLFAQAYLNRNSSGDSSFVYGTGDPIVDFSTQFNAQAQYDFDLGSKENIIVGVDYDRSEPDTEGTIFGRNEDDDTINEFGAYVQSLTRVSSKFDFTAALRADHHNIFDEWQFSPRVAAVFKPNAQSSFRATYNRAFSSPGNTTVFLDIVAAQLGGLINVRGRGVRDGYTWMRNPDFVPLFGSDLVARTISPNPAAAGIAVPPAQPLGPNILGDTYQAIYDNLSTVPIPLLRNLLPPPLNDPDVVSDDAINLFIGLLNPALTQVEGTTAGVMGIPDLTTGDVKFVTDVSDVPPLKQTTSQVFEIGYKGLIKDKFLFASDFYVVQSKNFVGPLLPETPLVYVPNFAADLSAAIATGVENNTILANALEAAGLTAEGAGEVIAGLAADLLPDAETPVAIVVPNENDLGVGQVPEFMLSYRNFGEVTFWGLDLAAQYFANSELRFFGNASIVSDDFFDNEELEETDTNLAVALNAPTLKIKGGFSYDKPNSFSFGGSGRYVKGFPVRSGPYSGEIDKYFLVDLNVGYDLANVAQGLRFDVSVSNVFDDKHREFIGAPRIGRLAMGRFTMTF